MSSQFLTFIFIILVSVQLSSCGWSFPWKNDKKEESSTEKTTEKSFKDDEPNSSPRVLIEVDSDLPQPKIYVESTSGSSVQLTTITTNRHVPKMPDGEFDAYPEEESSNFPNSEKEIKSIPPTSTSSTDKIVNYVSSTTTQITDSSTPTTEKSEIMKRSSHSSPSKGSLLKLVNYVPSMVHWLVLVQTAASWAIQL